MTNERFRASDYRFLAVCLALLAGATWFSVGNFYRAFPEASIDFRVNRDEAGEIAARALSSRGYRMEGYRRASVFAFDDSAKTFLEREAGLERANQVMGTRLRLWRWAYRWFRPLQKEEYRVDITTRGELAGFAHDIPEDAARPDPGPDRARAIAEEFLRSTMHRDPAQLDFVESSDTRRPHRTDRAFSWKERDFDLHDATIRLEVAVLGDEVGGYREYLKIPEQWTRGYERLRSRNEMAQTVDMAFMAALFVGLIVVIVLRVRRHDVRWRRAAVIGLVGMALQFLANLNQLGLQEFEYPTTDSYSSFLSRQVLQALFSALGAGGLLFVLAAGAEPLYREFFRDKVSVGNLFSLDGVRTRRFLLGSVLGISLCAIFIAYQTAFYIVAYRYGAWSPADVPYSDMLNTKFPWLFVLIGGYLPAVSEEFLFRMFAIPFLRRLVWSLAFAVVAAGFIWGFGHAGYPQQPFWIRGVEVGVGGVVLGAVMLRWGILPTLVWHYSVDAMYTALLLLRSHSLYFRLSGAASAGVLVLPVAVALALYWKRGGFASETGLLNGDEGTAEEPPAETEPEPAAAPAYGALSSSRRWAAAALFAGGLAALLIPAARFGDQPKYRTTDRQARVPADRFVRTMGLDPAAFRQVTFPENHWEGQDALAGKYFLERQPVAAASRMFDRYRPMHFWVTRYFKSLDREEVSVSVHPETGAVLGFIHTVPEDRPGADLSPERAQQLAFEFAAAEGRDLSAMDLKESASEKKKARRDYTLEWEARPGDPRNLDEAHYRIHMEVAGDRVTTLRSYWKLPEAYVRARERQNFASIAVLTVRICVISAIVVEAVLLLIGAIRRGAVRWRQAIRLAVPVTLLIAVGVLLGLKVMLQNYNTAIPLQTFEASLYIGMLIVVLFGFVFMAAAAALVTSYFPESLAALAAPNRRNLAADALAALAAAAGVALLVGRLQSVLVDRFHVASLFSVGDPSLLVNHAPALGALAGGVRALLTDAALLAAIVLILDRLPKPWMRWAAGPVAVFALLPGGIHTAGEFALYYSLAVIAVVAAAAVCFVFARRNYLAYALVIWALALRGPVGELFGIPITTFQAQAWIVVAVFAATLVWALLPALGRPAAEPGIAGA